MRHVYRPAIFWPLAGTTTMQTVTAMMFLTAPVLAPAMADDVGFQPSHVGLYTAWFFWVPCWFPWSWAPLPAALEPSG